MVGPATGLQKVGNSNLCESIRQTNKLPGRPTHESTRFIDVNCMHVCETTLLYQAIGFEGTADEVKLTNIQML